MANIETLLGNSQELEENSIVYFLVEKAAGRSPVITANFAANISGGYVVVEAPENLVELIFNTSVQQEYEKAWLYVEGLKDHNKQEKERLEDYELRRLQQEEDAKKAPLELILEGLVESGIPVGFMLSSHRENGVLYQNQKKTLLKLLENREFDRDALVDLEEVLEGREFIDGERTWKILTEQYNVRLLREEPGPEIKFMDVPFLLEELESVVKAACKRQPLDGMVISSGSWDEAGIGAQEVYNKVAEAVVPLNNRYLFVKATGAGEVAGAVRVLELDSKKNSLKQGTPKQLRTNLRLPTEIVEDVYRLGIVLAHTYAEKMRYLYPELDRLSYEEAIGMAAVIFERMLGGKTVMAASFYPDASTEKIDAYRERFSGVAGAIEAGIEGGEQDYSRYNLGNGVVVSANEVRGAINYLVCLLPEELYLLRKAQNFMRTAEKDRRDFELARDRGMRFKEGHIQVLESIKRILEESKNVYRDCSEQMLFLAEGAKLWPLKTPHEPDLKVLEFYGLRH